MIRKICVVILLSCSIAWGQSFVSAKAAGVPGFDPNAAHVITANGSLPQFNAVTIRPAVTRDQQINSVYAYPGGRIFCAHCTLQFLTMLAFNLPDWQITGSTELDARYDIDATAAQGPQSTAWNSRTPLTEEQRQMLKSLLIERFGLKGHRETRVDTVYLLQRGDQPLKLLPPLHPDESHWAGGVGGGPVIGSTGMRGKNISMSELATRISGALKRPVLDQTGLTGTFDFEYRISDFAVNTDVADSVLTSMHGIGLKLTPSKGPIEMLVIDHAVPPSQN